MVPLTLIRGIVGSGKTTLAKQLIGDQTDVKHYEADMYFMVDGVYQFDYTKIKEAHEWCQGMTRQAILDGYSVIVSNTFVKRWEMEPYIAICRDPIINCIWNILVCNGEYQNVHNVPEDVIARMKATWED